MRVLDSRHRDVTIRELQNTLFDLLIVGGGITGAGILREASLRGLKVALVEAEDFASGTSSKSTKLIHGGIRYLAMGHVHVVREAARERKRVHELAPHLAEPQWLMLPSSNLFEYYKYRLGVNIYEQLGQVGRPDLHFNLGGSELAEREPLLDINRYSRACIYREYLTDDARLVLANIRAGVNAGGVAVNRLRVTGVIKDNATISAIRVRCGLTEEEFIIRGKGVVNAAGPWVESLCDLDGLPSEKPLVLSKGIHVVVPRSKFPLKEMVLMVAKDSRPVFAIPRGSVVYIGTTDSRYDLAANIWPQVLGSEVEYLFKPIRDYFNVNLTLSDCQSTWAGLRPLISQRGKSTREISRRDEIWVSRSGLITIAGGKLTGYRKMAEDTVDKAIGLLGLVAKAPGDDMALPGGDFSGGVDRQAATLASWQLEDAAALHLTRLYGAEAPDVLGLGAHPLAQGGHVFSGEVIRAVRQEGALSLEDVIYRRTRAAYYRPSEVADILESASILMAQELGWSQSKRIKECESVRGRLQQDSIS